MTESALQKFADYISYEALHDKKQINVGKGKEVYSAKYKGDPVAVKMLEHDNKGPLPAATTEAFKKEIRIAQSLINNKVVQVYGACVEYPNLAIVMELMAGNLEHLLATKPIPWPIKIRMAIEIAGGLQYLHNHEVHHRNICSSNILYNEDFRVKLSGYGVAKLFFDPKTHVTGTKAKGTSAWLAPELNIKKNPPYSVQSDVFAFGVVLWELATQKMPYKGLSEDDISEKLDEGNREDIPNDVPPAYAKIIESCWEQLPENRALLQQVIENLVTLQRSYPVV